MAGLHSELQAPKFTTLGKSMTIWLLGAGAVGFQPHLCSVGSLTGHVYGWLDGGVRGLQRALQPHQFFPSHWYATAWAPAYVFVASLPCFDALMRTGRLDLWCLFPLLILHVSVSQPPMHWLQVLGWACGCSELFSQESPGIMASCCSAGSSWVQVGLHFQLPW